MTDHPNILLIFTDQQRFDTIGALGNPVIRTPHLDRLVREGTAFTSAYTPAPECVPARASLLFGQYPQRTRCYRNGHAMPLDSKETYMAALVRAGYHAHGIGKCHFEPYERGHELNGFSSRERQEEITGHPDRDDYLQFLWASGQGHLTDIHGVRGEMYYFPQPAQMPAALHPTQWVGDRATDYIRGRTGAAQPWHLFASFIHPHPPFCPPAPWHKLYRDVDVPLPHVPEGWESLLIHVNRLQNRYKRRDRGWDLWLVRMMRAYYYACISFIDYQVGRMLAALEETGQLDRTLIVFTSDHGELLGDYRSFGKRSYHDAASRLPLLARQPGRFAPGARCDTPVSLVDLTATILDAAGTRLSTHVPDGQSLASIAAAGDADRMVFSQLNQAGNAIYTAVDARSKYVYSAPDQRELLFDRRRDPRETHDLANLSWDKRLAPVREQDRMRRALHDFLRATGEDAALDGDAWRTYPKLELPANPDASLLYQDHPWADQHLPGYSE